MAFSARRTQTAVPQRRRPPRRRRQRRLRSIRAQTAPTRAQRQHEASLKNPVAQRRTATRAHQHPVATFIRANVDAPSRRIIPRATVQAPSMRQTSTTSLHEWARRGQWREALKVLDRHHRVWQAQGKLQRQLQRPSDTPSDPPLASRVVRATSAYDRHRQGYARAVELASTLAQSQPRPRLPLNNRVASFLRRYNDRGVRLAPVSTTTTTQRPLYRPRRVAFLAYTDHQPNAIRTASIATHRQGAIQAIRRHVTHADASGNTPLLLCAAQGSIEMALLLCLFGADPNAANLQGQTPIQVAVQREHIELTKVLLRFGASLSLRAAARLLGHTRSAGPAYQDPSLTLNQRKLLRLWKRSNSASRRASQIESFVQQETVHAHSGDADTLPLPTSAQRALDDLARAIRRGNHSLVARTVAQDPSLARGRANGGTMLYHAAWHGHTTMVLSLLSAGAPLDDQSADFLELTRDRAVKGEPVRVDTAAGAAFRRRHYDTLAVLVEHGAEFPWPLPFVRILQWVTEEAVRLAAHVMEDTAPLAEALARLEARAHALRTSRREGAVLTQEALISQVINARVGVFEESVLFSAVVRGPAAAVHGLVVRGARADVLNVWHQTPIDVAIEHQRYDALDILLEVANHGGARDGGLRILLPRLLAAMGRSQSPLSTEDACVALGHMARACRRVHRLLSQRDAIYVMNQAQLNRDDALAMVDVLIREGVLERDTSEVEVEHRETSSPETADTALDVEARDAAVSALFVDVPHGQGPPHESLPPVVEVRANSDDVEAPETPRVSRPRLASHRSERRRSSILSLHSLDEPLGTVQEEADGPVARFPSALGDVRRRRRLSQASSTGWAAPRPEPATPRTARMNEMAVEFLALQERDAVGTRLDMSDSDGVAVADRTRESQEIRRRVAAHDAYAMDSDDEELLLVQRGALQRQRALPRPGVPVRMVRSVGGVRMPTSVMTALPEDYRLRLTWIFDDVETKASFIAGAGVMPLERCCEINRFLEPLLSRVSGPNDDRVATLGVSIRFRRTEHSLRDAAHGAIEMVTVTTRGLTLKDWLRAWERLAAADGASSIVRFFQEYRLARRQRRARTEASNKHQEAREKWRAGEAKRLGLRPDVVELAVAEAEGASGRGSSPKVGEPVAVSTWTWDAAWLPGGHMRPPDTFAIPRLEPEGECCGDMFFADAVV